MGGLPATNLPHELEYEKKKEGIFIRVGNSGCFSFIILGHHFFCV